MNSSFVLIIISKLTALQTRLREHFPLTAQGSLTLLVMLFALQMFGYGAMDLVVFALTICAIAIFLFSLFCVIFGGLWQQLRIRRHMAELSGTSKNTKLEAGFPNETGFTLQDLGAFPLIKISWRVVYPDQIETRLRNTSDDNLLVEEIIPDQRCKTSRIVRLFTITDVLGLCCYSWRQSQTADLVVLPKSNSIKALPLLRSLTSEDGIPSATGNPEGDRMEIRPYVPGDSVRNIMWKVYARNQTLNVRLAEKSVFHSNRTVAYLVSGQLDEAAAAVARIAIETGALGEDWCFGADGTDTKCEDVPTALEVIAASRALGEPFSYGLDDFLMQTSAAVGTHCIVFAEAAPGPWIANLKHTISQFKGRFSLVIATDGMKDEVETNLWQKLIFRNQGAGPYVTASSGTFRSVTHQSDKTELRVLLTDLSQLVESTLLVDRNSGLSFDKMMRKV